MASYELATRWEFDAPIGRVWDDINHAERWSDWWKAVEAVVRLTPGDAAGTGTVQWHTWRGIPPIH